MAELMGAIGPAIGAIGIKAYHSELSRTLLGE
jgi:hypothetical protein